PRLEHVPTEHGYGKRSLVEPDLAGQLMYEGDNGRVVDPPRSQKRPRVDLVDDDVVGAVTFGSPEAPSRPVDAEPTSTPNDLDPRDDLARRFSVYRCGEQRQAVAAGDEGTGDLLGQHLCPSGGGVRQ